MKKRVVSLGLAAMMAMSMTLAVALEMRALLNQQQKTHRAQRELTAKYLKSAASDRSPVRLALTARL